MSTSTYLVFLEERATDVTVERVGEVVLQVLETRLENLVLLGVVDAHDEQRDEPGERVLVHRVDVGQVGDAEEEDGAVDGDRLVAEASLVDFLLSLLSDRLQRKQTQTMAHAHSYHTVSWSCNAICFR